MSQTAKRVVFTGNVQGVGFRFSAVRTANRYGLGGWVRNRPDGAVEMFAQGDADHVADCIRDIEKYFAGYIRQTQIEEAAPIAQYKDFQITF